MQHYKTDQIRKDFPILQSSINGKPLVYLDNGATTQKPNQVIEAMVQYYSLHNANVHRGVHTLSQNATELFDAARASVQKFINAASASEIIFTKGTTDSINLLAQACDGIFLNAGDEILISEMEHHSNIVPWQRLCQKRGLKLKAIPVDEKGELILNQIDELINDRTKWVSLVHVSNTLGTVNPIRNIIEKAHQKGALVSIDGAQAVSHLSVDVQALDCDFYSFSGHKLYGPTGIGVLYGKAHLLDQMQPYQSGGGMIKTVTLDETVYADVPQKFESGTPNIEGAIGLAAAIEYLYQIGFENIASIENELLHEATRQLATIEGLHIIGNSSHKASVVSFIVDGVHPFDIGSILDKQGIAVRTGHHCTQPLMQRYGIPGTVRASFAFYNTIQEIEALTMGLQKALKMLR